MKKLLYILIAMGLQFPVKGAAQNYEQLWATGTAVPQGTVELTKRPDGLFRFAGPLTTGELKIMTTETFLKGVTKFLKPQLVDAYLINHGLRYVVTSDETQPGWVVSFCEETYRMMVDPVAHTVTGELMLPWNEVLLAGSAFEGGSNRREWDRNAMLPFQRDHDDPYLFTWTGELGIFDGVVEPGRFKLEGQMTWGPRELHPYVQDEDILESKQMRQGGDDTKWHVSKPGTYRIKVNLFYETFEAELLDVGQNGNPAKIEKADDMTGVNSLGTMASQTSQCYDLQGRKLKGKPERDSIIYDLQGRRVQNPERGIYIMNHKKIMIR